MGGHGRTLRALSSAVSPPMVRRRAGKHALRTALHGRTQVGAFGDPGRDPRGWTVTVAYAALVPTTNLGVKAAVSRSRMHARVYVPRYARTRRARPVGHEEEATVHRDRAWHCRMAAFSRVERGGVGWAGTGVRAARQLTACRACAPAVLLAAAGPPCVPAGRRQGRAMV